MTRRIVEHFAATGETIERDMTETEEAQADLDLETLQTENASVDEPAIDETPVVDETPVEGEQPQIEDTESDVDNVVES